MPYLGKQPVNVIKNNAVTTNTIADDAVTNAKVAPTAINTTELADNSVQTAKINANAVTDAKLNNNAVTTNKIVDLNVTQGKLADEAVSEAKLHAGNAPTNDYVLTAASGQPGGLIWSAPSVLKNWTVVSEFTEANGNPLSNVTELIFDVVANKRYVIEADIYDATTSSNANSHFACQFSDVNNSTFNVSGIYSKIGRSGQQMMLQGSQNSTTGILTNPTSDPIGTLNSSGGIGAANYFGVHGTWEYYQHNTTNNSAARTSYPAIWGMYYSYAATYQAIQTTHLYSNGTGSTNIDKIRLFIHNNNMSGDIRVLRRD